ncbi:hypothetical protein POL68_18705 [Stigmatella sp. ncwal1]|uniref:Lipoprotein n=1 Tax=Stigmatella ashevillensis TaxID=2995309 RepID=A0ABT5DBT1_9BACT|nr:hypothetical protein [Stigmatella ashevillena]MDC0710514.1 hypothetical protein [Stigmatella ashevillena]
MNLRRIALLLSVLAVVAACITDPVFPGDQVLGTFRFEATVDRQRTTCDLRGPDFASLSDAGTFLFDGTFSRNADQPQGWLTVQGFARDAGYEGARVVSVHRAATRPPSCGPSCEGTEVEESLNVLLLSNSQDTLIGRRCSGLVDGGVPDGGAQPPGPTPTGYDVERACGTLTDDFIPGKTNCTCTSPCRAVYTVEGTRVN